MLTEKQEEFCRKFAETGDAVSSARAAGYREAGVERRATRLLTDQRVRDRILALGGALSHVTELTPDRVVEELLAIGTFDLRSLFDESGRMRPVGQLDAKAARAISSIEVTTKVKPDGDIETVHKVKTCSKERALELLGKHLGMWAGQDTDEVGDETEDDAIALARAWDRVKAGGAEVRS